MEYVCERCHHTTTLKTRHYEHLVRVHPCEPVYSDVSVEYLLSKLDSSYLDKPFSCNECKARFQHSSSLSRHKATHKKSFEPNQESMISSHNTTQSHNNQSFNTTTNSNSNNTTTNSNNTTNINITINLSPYGEHSVSHVEEKLQALTSCLKNILGDGIPNVVEMIHMDPKVPENHNVRLKRERHPGKMLVYVRKEDGTAQWEEKDLNTTLHQLIVEGTDILIRHNNKIMNEQDIELYYMKSEKLSNIRSKKRGSYAGVKNGVLSKFKSQPTTV
jgi:Cu/Zn superoxide dismutase